MTPVNYQNAHLKIKRQRGPARDHLCSCGKRADQWAFQHNAGGRTKYEDGRPYSEDPNDYAPMCFSCHQTLDWQYSSEQRHAKMRENGHHVGTVHGQRIQNESEYAAAFKARMVESGRTSAQRLTEQGRAAMRAAGVTVGAAAFKATYRCDECGRVISALGGMASHQRSSGHTGKTRVDQMENAAAALPRQR